MYNVVTKLSYIAKTHKVYLVFLLPLLAILTQQERHFFGSINTNKPLLMHGQDFIQNIYLSIFSCVGTASWLTKY